jgi:DNA-binding transcriptional MocR family regulator
MLRGLDETLGGTDATWSRPEGGFFIWLKLPTGGTAESVVDQAARERISIVGGPAFMPTGGGDEFIRLAFSYATLDEIAAGTRRLGDIIKAALPHAAGRR